MDEIRSLYIFDEGEELSDRVWMHVSDWGDFARNTLGAELVNSLDSFNAHLVESYSHKSHQGRLHYLYTARGALYKSYILLGKAKRRELAMETDFKERLERLLPRVNDYIQAAERSIK